MSGWPIHHAAMDEGTMIEWRTRGFFKRTGESIIGPPSTKVRRPILDDRQNELRPLMSDITGARGGLQQVGQEIAA